MNFIKNLFPENILLPYIFLLRKLYRELNKFHFMLLNINEYVSKTWLKLANIKLKNQLFKFKDCGFLNLTQA